MLPDVALMVLGSFAPLFTRPVWEPVQVLVTGAILCRGDRTVAGVLRTLGLADAPGFCQYHRVLSRARWSGLQGAQILVGLLVAAAASQGFPLMILVDETVERRKGKRIKAKGRHRDAVRSTQGEVVKCWGLKWICLTLRVPLPWSPRPWALPFLTLLAPPARADEKAGRRHKTTVDWTLQAVGQVARWLGSAAFTVVGDGAYASVALARACVARRVTLVSRLRLDARLYGFPEAPAPGRRGRKPKKGARLPSLKQRLEDPAQPWRDAVVAWYGGARKPVRLLSGVCLWHTPGQDPVRLRWVLVADPAGQDRPQAFFATDDGLTPERIVEVFVLRWNIAVTFAETRRHLGVVNPKAMVGPRHRPHHARLDGAVVAGLPDRLASGWRGGDAGAAGGLVQEKGHDLFRRPGLRSPRQLGQAILRQRRIRRRAVGIIAPRRRGPAESTRRHRVIAKVETGK